MPYHFSRGLWNVHSGKGYMLSFARYRDQSTPVQATSPQIQTRYINQQNHRLPEQNKTMLSVAIFLASGLTAAALPSNTTTAGGYVNPSYSNADLVALDNIIDALNSYAITTATPSTAVTRTAQGFVSLGSGTPTFTDIVARATVSAAQTVYIPDLDLEIQQYINPIQTTPPTKAKRDLFERQLLERGQVPVDQCSVPKTVTVIEWVDCAATSILCDVCPTKKSCDVCDGGYEWVVLATHTTPPCTTTTEDPCTTTTKTCPTCPGGIEYIIIGTAPDTYKTKRPCPVCPGGYEYIIADGSDYGMDLFYIIGTGGKNDHPADHANYGGNSHGAGYQPTPPPHKALKARETAGFAYSGTLIISSKSQLVVSTEFPLMVDWASLLTWDAAASATEVPITGIP
jgi:hypothetical protein